MTDEETLDWLCRLRSKMTIYMPKEIINNEMYEALDTVIKALEQEPSEDCISRADAEALFRNARGELHKSAIRNEQNGHPIKDLPTRDLMLLNAEQMIHLLPPVTPKQEPCKDAISRGVFEQVMWERDVAIDQLKELGYGFGEKPKTGHWIETAEEYYKAVNEYGGGVDENTPYFTDNIGCSVCLAMFSTIDNETERFNYCPHCGVKMVEPQESEESCDNCKHNSDSWDSDACDGCCGNHSGFEPQESNGV